MKAALYEQFREPLSVRVVPDAAPPREGALVRVRACGLCRSDWHGWMGHDPLIRLPHVPGHELAGEIAAVGAAVRGWRAGDRVTVPFVNGCGRCPQCLGGNQQVCDAQRQPGFTHWGAFAELVAIDYADTNLIRLPASMDFVTAASLGCRFGTAWRAVQAVGGVRGGEWVAVHGCGGVGLSAVMIAVALGAQVAAVDVSEPALQLARSLGAAVVINARHGDPVSALRAATAGGADVSLDALGSPSTAFNSVACLRKRGLHVQVGLLLADQSRAGLPMDLVVAHELRIAGSHGVQAHAYGGLLALVAAGRLQPQRLVQRRVSLEEAALLLPGLGTAPGQGVAVIDRF